MGNTMVRYVLGLDIGSNSVGSVWIDRETGAITSGVSVFPAGVDESDDKRGEPKNAKRRMTRRTRITLARRAERKRSLRLALIAAGLLPETEAAFKDLLEATDPWELRRRGLDEALDPHAFGRVLLHLAQRRGALGLKIAELEEGEEEIAASDDDGKVKAAIGVVRAKMLDRKAPTFGAFIAMMRDERVTPIESVDTRKKGRRKGPREWRTAVRNKAASYEHCADRAMIRHEFHELWNAQAGFGGPTAAMLTEALRLTLDDPERRRFDHDPSVSEQDRQTYRSTFREGGLLFGQRRATWDLGTLGRCVLEPSERCVPHADMHASRYRVIETVNNLKIIDGSNPARSLTVDERTEILAYLSGPLGEETRGARKGQPKRTVSVTDLRNFMGTSKEGWGRATKTSRFRFNIEADEDKTINTDWFSREIVHQAIGADAWAAMAENLREGFNRAILRNDPDEDGHAERLRAGVMTWGGLDAARADALVAAWKGRPRPDAKRLNMSRRAVRNVLRVMDGEPWPDHRSPTGLRWPTQIEARKAIAGNADFRDIVTGEPLDDVTRRRYATGAKGATARDRYYMKKEKHWLRNSKGEPVLDECGRPLSEPPPAPMISNPVVRKAIHEVRRHVVEYMLANGRRPDEVYIELAREAKMGKQDADRQLFRNRLRDRIKKNIVESLGLSDLSSTQQRNAVGRVVLAVQQDGICPLCGNQAVTTKITPRMAANGEGCEIAHIIPRSKGGHNGLSNVVLSHTKCNRDMGPETPRGFWNGTGAGSAGFDEGMRWVHGIFGSVKRPKPTEVKKADGAVLWACYFDWRDDARKIERFTKDITDADVQGFTNRQGAATRYASRQVMAYLSDVLFDGTGLPERATGSGTAEDSRRIFASDGMWTAKLRREWGLFFDPHAARAHGLDTGEEQERKEKNRGDHHHHAIDAVLIALGARSVQAAWERREKEADKAYWTHIKAGGSVGGSYEDWMENYRRQHRVRPPAPFDYPGITDDDEAIGRFRTEVKAAVFGGDGQKPICHRPVKRKLVGALHEETLFGPVLDAEGGLTGTYSAKKSVLALTPKHLRLPAPETEKVAIERLAARRIKEKNTDDKAARKWARSIVKSDAYTPAIVDPPPGKPGIVRDAGLRRRLRACLEEHGLDPDGFTGNEIKKLAEAGKITQASGVPINSVVLLRSMADPVIIDRRRPVYGTVRLVPDADPASRRAYLGGNNHHIEIRVDDTGNWSGEIVSAYQAAQRKVAKIRAMRAAGVPKPAVMRTMSTAERRKWRPVIAKVEANYPLVDRSETTDGRFVMSLCEGETLWMKHKQTDAVGYFVVAKLDKPRSVILVPHWDARAAGERKDADGKKVAGSARDQFAATPTDLQSLAPTDEPHAWKVRVGPLGDVTVLDGD